MQKKYSDIILNFFAEHPAIAVNKVERFLNLPSSTLRRAKDRGIPAKHIFSILFYLADYGLKIDGYTVTADPSDGGLFFRKWLENVESSKDGVYTVKEARYHAFCFADLL